MTMRGMTVKPAPFQRGHSGVSYMKIIRSSIKRELRFAHDRGCRITFHVLVGFLSCFLLSGVAFGFPQAAKSSDAQPAAPSIAGSVTVVTRQGQTNELAGVAVSLRSQAPGSVSQSTVTGEDGRYQFTRLPAGTYALEVNQEGFQSWVRVIVLWQ